MVGRYLRTLQVEPIESPVPEPERGRTHRRKIVSTAPISKVSQEADMSTEKEQDQNLDAPAAHRLHVSNTGRKPL
jgi:hypothetical protein